MNEDILKYLDSLTLEQVSAIERSINRSALPKAKSFWGQVKDAKRTGWDANLSSVFAQRANKLGLKEVFRGYQFPKSVQDIAEGKTIKTQPILTPGKTIETQPKSGSKGQILTPGSFGLSSQGGFTPKPSDFKAGGANIPDVEDFSVQPVIPPSRAQALKGDGNVPAPSKNASIPPKKASRTKDEGISAPDMENPFENGPNSLKNYKGDGKDKKDSEVFARLKSLGFESLNKQVEQYEARADPDQASRLARRENINAFLGQAKGVLGPLVDTIDFIEQRRQTKQAEAVANKSMKQAPAPPMVRGENRILSNLIRDSQIAYSNPSQMIQPYQDQIDLGYQQDLSQAQELSGGQAGNMIGMSQAAAIRRNEASQKVAPMASQIYQQGLETTGALVGQQMQDDAWRDQQTISLYDTANRNNQEFQQQAGLGLAASRARQVQARNNMLDSLLQSPVFDVDSYMGYTRKNLTNPPTI